MKSKQIILNKHLNGVDIGYSNDATLLAMEEYAKEYHEAKVKKLNIDDVS